MLTGAPVNPKSGTFPSNLCLVNVIASNTYCNLGNASSAVVNFSKSTGVFNGSVKTGPLPATIRTSIPSACGTTKISEKIMAASKLYLLIG